MNLKIALLGATAFGLLIATGAYAAGGNNTTNVNQNGGGNSALVDQSGGDHNSAGDSGTNHALNQFGNGNVLTITQTGTDNFVVRNNAFDSGLGHPAAESGYAEQSSTRSTVSGAHNEATISQGTGGHNTVGILYQTQNGVGNTATVTQNGNYNWVTFLDQESSTLGGNNDPNPNQITATFNGDYNGIDTVNLDRSGVLTGWAALSGTTTGRLRQVNETSSHTENNLGAAGNIIQLQIDGNQNQYGLTQKGDANQTGLILIKGNGNQFGSYQTGITNAILAGEIDGSNNNVGIHQSGTSNSAQVSSLGTGSNGNNIGIFQSGTNTAATTVTGSTNQAVVLQYGTNSATVSITGDSNGSSGSFGSNAAGTLVSDNPDKLSDGLIQQGTALVPASGDSATLTIYGDNNQFALASLGSNNTITGTVGSAVQDSSNNQAAVLQQGDHNTAVFNQVGTGGNVVAINQ